MVGNGNGDCAIGQPLLHNDVAAPPTNFRESMPGQDGAHFLAGENRQLTQRPPQFASRIRLHEAGVEFPEPMPS